MWKEMNEGSQSKWESTALPALNCDTLQYAAVFLITFSIVHNVPGVPNPYSPSRSTVLYTLLVRCLFICWDRSGENTCGFLPFVFASIITQFTHKYGLSCPFSMAGPQTNLPLALIWKMSPLSWEIELFSSMGRGRITSSLTKRGLLH